MRKWPAKLGAGVIAVGLFASAAEAAMVTDIRGDVLVNRGVGFAPVKEPVELAPGDLVLAGSGGSARVHFSKDCEITVRPGQIVRVTVASPCQKAGAQVPGGNTAAGAGGGISTSTLVIGGLVIAGGGGLALGLAAGGGGGGGGQNRPASP